MHKTLLALSFILLLSSPALAQSDDSCSPTTDSIDYVQLGDDIILVECPAMEGGNAACSCHAPPGADGKCRVYACTADGAEKKAEVKPAPALEEKEKAAVPPKADAAKPVKPAAKKKKPKPAPPAEKPAPAVEEKKAEVPPAPAPAPAVEEKKVEAPPVQEEAKPAPSPAPVPDATGEKKIEYVH
ncbi:MAG: hypothetical protein EPN97_04880 [Alphaproteobacteria bacterium]|nr:MAG: hypothetical protein EPN97_04880 [Alphaproteobacteria bacterium]